LTDLAEETDRLQILTTSLLRLSRGDADHPAEHGTIDLSTLLQDVCDSLRPLAESKKLSLTCNLSCNLTVNGDRDDLIRLFVNLIDNAVKYTQHGAITVSVNRNKDNSLTVAIADTGIGILPEHLPHIFDRFYRADQSRATPGAGLGLAIALEIARAHAGTIEVQSASGGGTIFSVRLSSY